MYNPFPVYALVCETIFFVHSLSKNNDARYDSNGVLFTTSRKVEWLLDVSRKTNSKGNRYEVFGNNRYDALKYGNVKICFLLNPIYFAVHCYVLCEINKIQSRKLNRYSFVICVE